MNVIHNEEEAQFEVRIDGNTGTLEYRMLPGQIVMLHTEVPPELEGKGVAGALAKAALEYARTHKLQVVPNCPFVAGYIKRHPDYLDLVPDVHRKKVS
jgi:predicted GNAT family acetyltransferase